MITILDMFLILIISIFLIVLSLTLLILPFSGLENSIILNTVNYLKNLKGNYILILIGVVILAMALKLASILFKKKKYRSDSMYINQWTDYGEVRISASTIVGLVKAVSEKVTGIKNINVGIEIVEGKLFVEIKGETSPEINIPEMTEQLQKKIKEHIETSTGVEVSEVKIYIVNVSQPVRNLR